MIGNCLGILDQKTTWIFYVLKVIFTLPTIIFYLWEWNVSKMKGSFLYNNFSVGPSYHRWMKLTPPTLPHRTSGRQTVKKGTSCEILWGTFGRHWMRFVTFVLPSRSWDLKWLETSENSNNSTNSNIKEKKFTEFLTKNPWIWKEKTPFSKSFLCEKQTKKNNQLLTFPGYKISTTSQLPGFVRNLELLSKLLIFLLQSIHRLCFLLPVKNVQRSYGDWAKYSQRNPKPEWRAGGDLACPYHFCCPQVVGNNTSKKLSTKGLPGLHLMT